jgi:hypothetical protein
MEAEDVVGLVKKIPDEMADIWITTPGNHFREKAIERLLQRTNCMS